jgi:uncharacterized integral membrane protein (TIGR00698 family)
VTTGLLAFRLSHPLVPGVALACAVAIAAFWLAKPIAGIFPLPVIVIALLIGIALHTVADRPAFVPGLRFCVSRVLRWAVALLGLRVSLGEIAELGSTTAAIVIASMFVTIVAGVALARALGQRPEFGALAGAGTAVCGASATLATATVLPAYEGKDADVVFVVMAVNALSTVAMVSYPLICAGLSFDPQATGVMLGATIHDVAQVVGAGYAVSEPVGNTAVVVKLFRVLLLLPVVIGIGYWITRSGSVAGKASVPVPVFALAFLGLCILNSTVGAAPALAEAYQPIKSVLVTASSWGLLVAIAALGLGTSVAALRQVGWRHLATISATTVVILAVVTAALLAVR